ncbi:MULTISPECIES: FKBP-type peptidyl-prolyl cis-trans isomerase N-terminal domain-containing protein [Enterobacter]|uniref:FKBP-type peptidyl-prolyl cis-trans isomerase N-terminal domain-containing protein n=1 Tax=Enterobacter TaxID=547 RepID=UPI0015D4D399|nr:MULTISPECIES: FKBP-type peptidyl-prolyl cis-trans isomerase N-terminal domain-containing protein [Enterobacter]
MSVSAAAEANDKTPGTASSAETKPADHLLAPAAASSDKPAVRAASGPAIDTAEDCRTYANGVVLGRELLQFLALQRKVGMTLSPARVLAGLEDSYSGHTLRLSDDDVRQALQDFNADFRARMQTARADELARGTAFRAGFRQQKGIVADAGALYLIDNKGRAPRLRTSDMATLQVNGHLPDGTVFYGNGVRQVSGVLRQVFGSGLRASTFVVSRAPSGVQTVYCVRDESAEEGIVAHGIRILRRGQYSGLTKL